jgi:ssRNA-specific RNase YbeY (16S rRNA maturation enzyme)
VIFHGALHLAGFRDKSRKEHNEMRLMEEKYLKQYKGKSSLRDTIPRLKSK